MEKENISYNMRDYIGISSSSSSSSLASSTSSASALVGVPSGSAPSGLKSEENQHSTLPSDLNPNETELRLGFGPPQPKSADEYPAFALELGSELEPIPSISAAKLVLLPSKRPFAEALVNSQDVNIAAPSSSSPNNNNNTTSRGPWMNMPTPSLFSSLSTRPPRVPQVPTSNNFSTPPPKFDASPDHNNASAKRCVVGWPPIRSFRKNTTVSAPPKPSATNTVPLDEDGSKLPADKDPNQDSITLFVKANMDGVPIGRKLDLKTYDGYDNLKKGVAQMFEPFINGHRGGHNEESSVNNTQMDLLFQGSEYVLTHEDKDGDWMLVGDVPWGMFLSTVKRLRIMRSSDAIGLGQHLSTKKASKH